MTDSLWYPSVEDVLAIHDDIVSEYPDTPSGVKSRGDIEFALNYIEAGSFGKTPETIHEKAFHLLRLLVANHPFVDANKRTALNTTVVFYFPTDIDSSTTTKSGRYSSDSGLMKRISMKQRVSNTFVPTRRRSTSPARLKSGAMSSSDTD